MSNLTKISKVNDIKLPYELRISRIDTETAMIDPIEELVAQIKRENSEAKRRIGNKYNHKNNENTHKLSNNFVGKQTNLDTFMDYINKNIKLTSALDSKIQNNHFLYFLARNGIRHINKIEY